MGNSRNKYLIILLGYGVLINAVTFSEVYFDLSVSLSTYFGYALMGLLTISFASDWRRFTTINVFIKILVLLFILLETYISGVVLIAISLFQDSIDSRDS
jgi:hypothetical protein